ncbi:hypothetical protein [Phycicoccus sp. Soil802]|uniref:hypothetical protein n=1 Tax=Phycicoccus sp. Soil802 TaxID=1736414 RepID=UPI0007034814|nr:hypothetical protein [Phycicoccus sp. Soil802]KRF28880.1 hypothetical protein ASG91_04375 [Phycicoccus sp. Soil802]
MSQPSQQQVQPRSKPPVVRLPTWVNVVLVLILFAACSAANDDDQYVDNGGIASQVVNQLQSQNGWGTPEGPASAAEVEDLCRLLGAVAAKQKVPLTVMNQDQQTRCREVAQEAGTPTPTPTATSTP